MFQTNTNPIYDPLAVQPMRDELAAVGFTEMLTEKEVRKNLDGFSGTVLLVLNSVCGCAAGTARPAVMLALQNSVIPDRLVTSFAGQDREAVNYIRREYLKDYPPSSPFIVLLEDGKLVHVLQRFNIEGRVTEDIASELTSAFQTFCNRKGPSVPKEHFEKIIIAKQCGSKIPLFSENG
jgi:putative YphP/YqiW family bacilliredoxin